MSDTFVSRENTTIKKNTLSHIIRFIRELPALRKLLWIVIVLDLLAALSPQVFLWLASSYSDCSDNNACVANVPYVGTSIPLSFDILGIAAAFILLTRFLSWALFEGTGRWACQNIHARMVDGVSGTRTTFFDENPSGRMINRLVRDFDTLQTNAVARIGDSLGATCDVICGGAIIMVASPVATILVLPTILVFFYVQSNISQMLQRCAVIRSVKLGELIHRETDVIEGARTFLLYNQVESLILRVERALSDFIDLNLVRARIDGWGRFITANVGSFYSFIALSAVTYALYKNAISDVLAGVLITAIFRLAPSFGWLSWSTAYLIEAAGIIRRIFEYADLPNEIENERSPHLLVKKNQEIPTELASNGPFKGELEFRRFTMSYRTDSPLVLKDLSIKIPYGSRVGIIGRTGSGKSSIVQSLYRMVYVQDGDILIGGRSIFSLDVDIARANFVVVPQDPYLFQGTVQSNLDRPGELNEVEMKRALELTGLGLPLEFEIMEGGSNLSLGERQLLCLTRALLSKAPFIILDEPTSGVDPITDATIQKLLQENLAGRTLITVAHRLDTLRDYDLIIELANGELKRVGTPKELLA